MRGAFGGVEARWIRRTYGKDEGDGQWMSGNGGEGGGVTDKRLRFKELVAQGKEVGRLQITFWINLEKYRRAEGFGEDGYGSFEDCLTELVQKIRRSRSTIWNNLRMVRLLIDSGKVRYEDVEAMGSTNSQALYRLHKATGNLKVEWIAKAKKQSVEQFKEFVVKLLKPTAQQQKFWKVLLPADLHQAWKEQVERVQKVLEMKAENAAGVVEFLHSLLSGAEDVELLHLAGQGAEAEAAMKKRKTG